MSEHEFPHRLTVRDTKVIADEGQRIYSTATGYGYDKCEYVRADLADALLDALKAALPCVIGTAERVGSPEASPLFRQVSAALARAGGQP